MKVWIIKTLSNESDIDDLDALVNNELIGAKLRTYTGNPLTFTSKRYHPKKSKVAAAFDINKVAEWKEHILKHIDQNELVELGSDWEIEPEF